MKTVTSVSGGRTSAYLAANYPADELVFALVRIEDEECRFPDPIIRSVVEDRIQAPFIATAEDDKIIYTMLDLEQHLGKKIHWVTGPTFDDIVNNYCGWLPNKLHRVCTQEMKMKPIFYWWAKHFGKDNPVIMNVGFRANEFKRANKMESKLNPEGLLEMDATFGKHPNGTNKWETVAWQKPQYPLITDGILKDTIAKYWEDKAVRFAAYNNCAGCFHRDPLMLRYQFDLQPKKMDWFARQEGGGKNYWKGSDFKYYSIKKIMAGHTLYPTDFNKCDEGYCEIE